MPLDYPKVLNASVVGIKDDSDNVYVGRPSKWGNPFVIGKDGTRSEVINKYIAWNWQQDDLRKSISELNGKNLICWCSPKKCHAEFLLQMSSIDEILFECEEIKE